MTRLVQRWLPVWVALSAGTAPLVAQQAAAPDTTRPGAPVVLRGDTVLFVRARLGSFTAEERAAAITERLRRLSPAERDERMQLYIARAMSVGERFQATGRLIQLALRLRSAGQGLRDG